MIPKVKHLWTLVGWLLSPFLALRLDFYVWIIASLPARQVPYSILKRFLLMRLGAHVGKGVYVYPGTRVYCPKGLTIGNHVVVSAYTIINASGTVTIGDYSLLGYGCKVLSANHTIPQGHDLIWGAGHDHKPVVIEKGAWVGAHVIVLPGVTVGEGAVVGAGAVVTRDVEPFSIVAGVPAKHIRYRV